MMVPRSSAKAATELGQRQLLLSPKPGSLHYITHILPSSDLGTTEESQAVTMTPNKESHYALYIAPKVLHLKKLVACHTAVPQAEEMADRDGH